MKENVVRQVSDLWWEDDDLYVVTPDGVTFCFKDAWLHTHSVELEAIKHSDLAKSTLQS